MELYSERGFEQTTVAEIAKRAGLTERTFFRHFADKREVLFGGAELQDLLVEAVAGVPGSAAPIDALAVGLEALAEVFDDRRAYARKRQAVIAANAELQERELIKLASLSAALADTLRLTRRPGAGGEPDRRGGDRRLQGRLRTLDRGVRGTRHGAGDAGTAGRAQGRDGGRTRGVGGRTPGVGGPGSFPPARHLPPAVPAGAPRPRSRSAVTAGRPPPLSDAQPFPDSGRQARSAVPEAQRPRGSAALRHRTTGPWSPVPPKPAGSP